MKTINYKVKKQTIQIEVSDEFAVEYEKITTEHNRAEWRAERNAKNHNLSYEELTDAGVQFEDEKPTPEDNLINKEMKKTLYRAIRMLTPEQQKLVHDVFFVGKKQSDIAKEMNVGKSAIANKLTRIYDQIKKFFEKIDS